MSELHEVRNVTVSIQRAAKDVYRFAHDGANLPRWASGLGKSIDEADGKWIAEGPLGRVEVRFAPENELGVLDHYVTLPSGQVVHNPVRVIPNGKGSTVIFTLLRLEGVTDESLAQDMKTVEHDLSTLKGLLEGEE